MFDGALVTIHKKFQALVEMAAARPLFFLLFYSTIRIASSLKSFVVVVCGCCSCFSCCCCLLLLLLLWFTVLSCIAPYSLVPMASPFDVLLGVALGLLVTMSSIECYHSDLFLLFVCLLLFLSIISIHCIKNHKLTSNIGKLHFQMCMTVTLLPSFHISTVSISWYSAGNFSIAITIFSLF